MQHATSVASTAIAALLLALSGCSHQTELEPADVAVKLDGDIAWVGVQGVHVLAKGDDWEGDQDILKHATPVYLVIDNRSLRPLRVHYSKISLSQPGGRDHEALPPSASMAADREEQSWALHEVVIQPGGNAAGYVYFQPLPKGEKRVTLALELVDARSGDRFAVARIPFSRD